MSDEVQKKPTLEELEEYHKYGEDACEENNEACDSDCGVSATSRDLHPIFSQEDFQWQDGTIIVPAKGRLAKRGRPMARIRYDEETGGVFLRVDDYPVEGVNEAENPDFWLELSFQLPTRQKRTRTDIA